MGVMRLLSVSRFGSTWNNLNQLDNLFQQLHTRELPTALGRLLPELQVEIQDIQEAEIRLQLNELTA